ncbi:hypothetical protein IBX73_00955 [candidate division WOR-3 bacterium]|nr:hypothetical protein [candidate division WOR-3 bacterium]
MILLAMLLISAAVQDEIQIIASTPSMLSFRLEFSDFRQSEQVPITRFIISEKMPTYEYTAAQIDSSTDAEGSPDTGPVMIGDPVPFGDVTLYPVTIQPSYVNNQVKRYVKTAEVRLDFIPSPRQPQLSPSMSSVFRSLILNFRQTGNGKPMGYLIITPEAYLSTIQPLARWKEKKGWHVEIRTLSQTGSTAVQIRNYIAGAYSTWSPRPEYVLLAGNDIPAAANITPPGATDHPYTLIQGDDFLSELLIGRLPAANELELATMVAKIIGYETNPFAAGTSWYTRSLMVGANEPANMTTPLPTKRFVRDKLISKGITNVDTVFFPMPASEIANSVNQGALFVNYRAGQGLWGGWPFPYFINSDVLVLENGWKLPVVTSITCMTGNFTNNACFGKNWLVAGNPVTPRGAVAFIGASATSTSSRWNNCLDYGIYWAICNEDIHSIAAALYRGKMEVYANFPGDTTWLSGSSFYFHTYNLLGDPSLELWTGVPDSFIATHASSMPAGTNSFSVHIANSASQPVSGAMVSLYKVSEVKEVGYTDASGNIEFNFATSTQDTMFVTVTKHNFKPYRGYAMATSSAVFVGHHSHAVNDPSGNNNGEVNPGETIEFGVTLKNYGTSTTATNVTARLSIDNANVTITDSIKSYGNINPGATAAATPFIFNVSTNAQHNEMLEFDLNITSGQGNWSGTLWVPVKDAELIYEAHQVQDANGILEPGETRDLLVSVKNTGGLAAGNVWGVLRSANSGLTVTDSTGYFGNVAVGGSATNSSNYFTLSAHPQLTPGTIVRFSLILTGDNGLVDTTGFRLTLGIVDSSIPLGPDAYGYYAYDDTDAGYLETPVFDWIEIDPAHGGPGDTISLGHDETKTVGLPFNFKFYGNWYNRVSICSNGYMAMDSTTIADMYNWRIPAAGGPPLLIAPFWDDLSPNITDSSGNVCYWHDAANHRFVIEWSRVQHIHDPTNPTPAELQTFQVVLYDPQYYPTLTGDGEILFQYLEITNDDVWHNYATVGIENYGHTTGIEYTYANTYPPAAAPLANGRAIKFTTSPPDTFTGVAEFNTTPVAGISLQVSPNPSSKLVSINFSIEQSAKSIGLDIYNAAGRLVKHFHCAMPHAPCAMQVVWDGTDNTGRRVPAGIYFVVLKSEHHCSTRKVVLVD